jgi:hypothetical protein
MMQILIYFIFKIKFRYHCCSNPLILNEINSDKFNFKNKIYVSTMFKVLNDINSDKFNFKNKIYVSTIFKVLNDINSDKFHFF